MEKSFEEISKDMARIKEMQKLIISYQENLDTRLKNFSVEMNNKFRSLDSKLDLYHDDTYKVISNELQNIKFNINYLNDKIENIKNNNK